MQRNLRPITSHLWRSNLGAFLQMPPVMTDGRPVFAQRIEFDVISPSGQYNRADDINPSSGFWSLNPFWAMTFLPTSNTEFSTRLQYLHNFQNSDPAGGAMPFRAGDAVWANFAASYKVLPTLNFGLNGYYFQQIQNDTVNGQTGPKSETTNSLWDLAECISPTQATPFSSTPTCR